MGGRQRSLRGAEVFIRAMLTHRPAMTLAALCERVAQARHPQVSTKTMCVELQRLIVNQIISIRFNDVEQRGVWRSVLVNFLDVGEVGFDAVEVGTNEL